MAALSGLWEPVLLEPRPVLLGVRELREDLPGVRAALAGVLLGLLLGGSGGQRSSWSFLSQAMSSSTTTSYTGVPGRTRTCVTTLRRGVPFH